MLEQFAKLEKNKGAQEQQTTKVVTDIECFSFSLIFQGK